jgi:CIC family chloride channel protein
MPVSVVANFEPVSIDSLERGRVRNLLDSFPYSNFPVLENGKLAGMLGRREAERALKENRVPSLVKVPTCLPSQSIRDVEMLLIESPAHVVILRDHDDGKILGLLTLHDLLRAEVSFAEQQG